MEQLLVHILGDFCLQSDYMAMNKSKRWFPCIVHVIIYTSCFLMLTTSWKALLVIGLTHLILDHYPQMLRRLIWLRNHLNPRLEYVPYDKCNITGYYDTIGKDINPPSRAILYQPIEVTNGYSPRLNYVTIWLYIVHDNLTHLAINYFALKYL